MIRDVEPKSLKPEIKSFGQIAQSENRAEFWKIANIAKANADYHRITFGNGEINSGGLNSTAKFSNPTEDQRPTVTLSRHTIAVLFQDRIVLVLAQVNPSGETFEMITLQNGQMTFAIGEAQAQSEEITLALQKANASKAKSPIAS